MKAYVLSHHASQDLIDLWQHVAEDNLANADALLDRVEAGLKRLAEMPGIGHFREELGTDELKVWRVDQVLIIYFWEQSPVEIVRIVSGFRNLVDIL